MKYKMKYQRTIIQEVWIEVEADSITEALHESFRKVENEDPEDWVMEHISDASFSGEAIDEDGEYHEGLFEKEE